MPRMVIGLFSRREDAEAARRELMLSGIAQRRITVDCPEDDPGRMRHVGEPLPNDRGPAGFIGRMFSGAMLDHGAVDRYLFAARHAQCVLAVHELGEDDVQRVHDVLAAHGALDADRARAGRSDDASADTQERRDAAPDDGSDTAHGDSLRNAITGAGGNPRNGGHQ